MIHNGNTDFYLSANQDGSKKVIKISFTAPGNASFRLEVFSPYQSGTIFSKDYVNMTKGQVVNETITVSSYGGYRVKTSLVQGYSYDYVNVDVHVNSPYYSETHIFTQSDVNQHSSNTLIIALSLIALGLITRLTWPMAAFAATISISDYANGTKNWNDTIPVIKDWSIKTRYSQPSRNYIRHETYVYNANNALDHIVTKDFTILHYGE